MKSNLRVRTQFFIDFNIWSFKSFMNTITNFIVEIPNKAKCLDKKFIPIYIL